MSGVERSGDSWRLWRKHAGNWPVRTLVDSMGDACVVRGVGVVGVSDGCDEQDPVVVTGRVRPGV
jgi:hypothetical protein